MENLPPRSGRQRDAAHDRTSLRPPLPRSRREPPWWVRSAKTEAASHGRNASLRLAATSQLPGKGRVDSNAARRTLLHAEEQRVPQPRGYRTRLGQGNTSPSRRAPGGRVRSAGAKKSQALRQPNAVADAVRYLARSDRSVEQVRLHLTRRGYSSRGIQNALTTLHRSGYLGDDAVALRLAHSCLLRRPVGYETLVEILRRRGFDRETANRAGRHAYDRTTEHDVAARFLGNLPVKFEDRMRENNRRARLLVARGFAQDVIETVLGSAPAHQDM
jgi:regulatory protein